MARKPNMVDRFMAEVVSFGGLPVTRGDAHKGAVAMDYSKKEMDYFVWRLPAIVAEPMPADEFMAMVKA